MRSLLVILLVLSGVGWEAKGQDLTGQWTGTAMADGQDHKLVLSITETDSSFAGVLHWYTPETRTIRHIVVSGRFYARDSTLTLREDSGAASNGGAAGRAGANAATSTGAGSSGDAPGSPPGGFYMLIYYRTAGRRDRLEGEWHMGDEFTGRYS